MTRHAAQRALKYNLTAEEIEKIIREGKRKAEGKTKTRYTLQSKNDIYVAICEEHADQTIVLTITKGG